MSQDFLKVAYELGAQAALEDLGLTKSAGIAQGLRKLFGKSTLADEAAEVAELARKAKLEGAETLESMQELVENIRKSRKPLKIPSPRDLSTDPRSYDAARKRLEELKEARNKSAGLADLFRRVPTGGIFNRLEPAAVRALTPANIKSLRFADDLERGILSQVGDDAVTGASRHALDLVDNIRGDALKGLGDRVNFLAATKSLPVRSYL